MTRSAAIPSNARTVLWGSELSPFALKIRASMQYAELPFRSLPKEGGALENAVADAAVELAKFRKMVVRYPATSPLDEYPLVPFVIDGQRAVLYDSTAIGRWLDATNRSAAPPLFPAQAKEAFVAALIDEAFDEFGLYMLHHNRWVVAAHDNNAGERLSREFSFLLPFGTGRLFARQFSRRQVRRLPYLFSVAPPGFSLAGVSKERTPPARAGFPPTHELLAVAWEGYLDAMDAALRKRPFLLGERFTIADASAFGHMGGNFIDESARRALAARAPRVYAWLESIWRGGHVGSRGELGIDGALAPLLRIIAKTFGSLMQQNETAYERHLARGETLFNERAFSRGRSLYDGELLGRPFRSVVKTFQVRTLRDLREQWTQLTQADRAPIEALAGWTLPFDAPTQRPLSAERSETCSP